MLKLDSQLIKDDKAFSHPADELINQIQVYFTRIHDRSLDASEIYKLACQVIKERL